MQRWGYSEADFAEGFHSLNEFELLSSEDEPGQVIRPEELEAFGIEGKITQQQEGGFVSEKTETRAIGGGGMSGGMSGGMGGDGMGGMNFSDMGRGDMGDGGMCGDGRGGGKRGGEMGRGGMGVTSVSSLELWALIQLATAPGSGT